MTYRISEDEQQPTRATEGGQIPIDKSCVRCGHNLRGQLHDAPCPECGLPAAQQHEERVGGEEALGAPVTVCARCGYDLRATPPGSACPECGLPVSEPTSAYDPLNVMPLPVIHRLRLGGSTCCAAMNVSVFILWSSWRGSLDPPVVARWLLATSIVWAIGVLLITPTINRPEGIVHGFHSRGRLRRAARWLQCGWIVAAGIGLLVATGQATGGWITLVRGAVVVSVLAGLTGAVLLAIVLERLADWVRDQTAGRLFSTFQFLLPATVVLAPLAWLVAVDLLRVMITVGLLLCAGGTVICFVGAMWGLSKSINLSVLHAHEFQDRQQRRYRRQMEHEQQMDQTVEKIVPPRRRVPPIDRRTS